MEENKKEKKKGKKKHWLILAGAVCFAAMIVFQKEESMMVGTPTLTIETPQKLSASATEEWELDVSISDLGDVLYPAASMSIHFDSSCLEFLGIREGNVFVLGETNGAGMARQLPEWSCNPEQCNKSGIINLMYLDLTGGKHAFSQELLAEENNVLVRLRFRLRGSVRSGDVYDLIVEDAVFAALDEKESLATMNGTLKTKNGRVVIGE